MGLLGMDVFQGKLANHLFGDLVLAAKLCKIADNIYFGGNTLTDLTAIFKEVKSRIDWSDLCAKPSKIKIHVKQLTLGLLWSYTKKLFISLSK